MSTDMFPDAAIEYILERHNSNDWMEHAVAVHSHKAHDDFYDMIGEGLWDLHNKYYLDCTNALEYYIKPIERDGEKLWLYVSGLLMDVKGYPELCVEAAEKYDHLIFFYGPEELERPDLNTNGLVQITSVAIDGYPDYLFPGFPKAAGEQSGTGVGTDPLVIVAGRGVSAPVAVQSQ